MKFLILFMFSLSTIVHAASDMPITKTMNDKDLKWGPCPAIFPKGCEMSVLHGDPAKKGADIFLKVPSQYVIPAHTHTSAEHMTLVSGELEIKYQGEAPMTLKQGTFTFGPAKQAHQAKCMSADQCVLYIGFEEPIDAKIYNGTL